MLIKNFTDTDNKSWKLMEVNNKSNYIELEAIENNNKKYLLKIKKNLFNSLKLLNKRILHMVVFNNETYSKQRVDDYNKRDEETINIFKMKNGDIIYNLSLPQNFYSYIVNFIKSGDNKIITKLIPEYPVVNDTCFKKNRYFTCSKKNNNNVYVKTSIVDTVNNKEYNLRINFKLLNNNYRTFNNKLREVLNPNGTEGPYIVDQDTVYFYQYDDDLKETFDNFIKYIKLNTGSTIEKMSDIKSFSPVQQIEQPEEVDPQTVVPPTGGEQPPVEQPAAQPVVPPTGGSEPPAAPPAAPPAKPPAAPPADSEPVGGSEPPAAPPAVPQTISDVTYNENKYYKKDDKFSMPKFFFGLFTLVLSSLIFYLSINIYGLVSKDDKRHILKDKCSKIKLECPPSESGEIECNKLTELEKKLEGFEEAYKNSKSKVARWSLRKEIKKYEREYAEISDCLEKNKREFNFQKASNDEEKRKRELYKKLNDRWAKFKKFVASIGCKEITGNKSGNCPEPFGSCPEPKPCPPEKSLSQSSASSSRSSSPAQSPATPATASTTATPAKPPVSPQVQPVSPQAQTKSPTPATASTTETPAQTPTPEPESENLKSHSSNRLTLTQGTQKGLQKGGSDQKKNDNKSQQEQGNQPEQPQGNQQVEYKLKKKLKPPYITLGMDKSDEEYNNMYYIKRINTDTEEGCLMENYTKVDNHLKNFKKLNEMNIKNFENNLKNIDKDTTCKDEYLKDREIIKEKENGNIEYTINVKDKCHDGNINRVYIKNGEKVAIKKEFNKDNIKASESSVYDDYLKEVKLNDKREKCKKLGDIQYAPNKKSENDILVIKTNCFCKDDKKDIDVCDNFEVKHTINLDQDKTILPEYIKENDRINKDDLQSKLEEISITDKLENELKNRTQTKFKEHSDKIFRNFRKKINNEVCKLYKDEFKLSADKIEQIEQIEEKQTDGQMGGSNGQLPSYQNISRTSSEQLSQKGTPTAPSLQNINSPPSYQLPQQGTATVPTLPNNSPPSYQNSEKERTIYTARRKLEYDNKEGHVTRKIYPNNPIGNTLVERAYNTLKKDKTKDCENYTKDITIDINNSQLKINDICENGKISRNFKIILAEENKENIKTEYNISLIDNIKERTRRGEYLYKQFLEKMPEDFINYNEYQKELEEIKTKFEKAKEGIKKAPEKAVNKLKDIKEKRKINKKIEKFNKIENKSCDKIVLPVGYSKKVDGELTIAYKNSEQKGGNNIKTPQEQHIKNEKIKKRLDGVKIKIQGECTTKKYDNGYPYIRFIYTMEEVPKCLIKFKGIDNETILKEINKEINKLELHSLEEIHKYKERLNEIDDGYVNRMNALNKIFTKDIKEKIQKFIFKKYNKNITITFNELYGANKGQSGGQQNSNPNKTLKDAEERINKEKERIIKEGIQARQNEVKKRAEMDKKHNEINVVRKRYRERRDEIIKEQKKLRKEAIKKKGELLELVRKGKIDMDILEKRKNEITEETENELKKLEEELAKIIKKNEDELKKLEEEFAKITGKAQAQSGNASAQPENASAQSGNTSAQPESTPVQSGNTSAQPESTPVQPESAPVQPENAQAKQGNKQTKQENASAQPVSPQAQPVSPQVQSRNASAKQENKSTQPESAPVQPESAPAQPVSPQAQPVSPQAQSRNTSTKQENKSVQPGSQQTKQENASTQSENIALPPKIIKKCIGDYCINETVFSKITINDKYKNNKISRTYKIYGYKPNEYQKYLDNKFPGNFHTDEEFRKMNFDPIEYKEDIELSELTEKNIIKDDEKDTKINLFKKTRELMEGNKKDEFFKIFKNNVELKDHQIRGGALFGGAVETKQVEKKQNNLFYILSVFLFGLVNIGKIIEKIL